MNRHVDVRYINQWIQKHLIKYNEMFDNVINNLKTRFDSLNKFEFLSSKYINSKKKCLNTILEKLQQSSYNYSFNFIKIKYDLIMLYTCEDF